MVDLPSNVQEQFLRDKAFYDGLLTHQRRALIEQVSTYWPMAKSLRDPEELPLLDAKGD